MIMPLPEFVGDGDVCKALHELQSNLMPLNKIKFGKACFSPQVSRDIQRLWTDYGGTTCSLKEAATEEHIRFFCYGRTDPWYGCLSQNAMAIFHASWIVKVVEANFMLPIAPFVLNSDFLASPRSLPVPVDVTPSEQVMWTPNACSNDVCKSKPPADSVYSSPLRRSGRVEHEKSSEARQHDAPRKKKVHRSPQLLKQTPPRPVTSTPRQPPSVPTLPTKRTFEAHFDPPRTIKKTRISVMPDPQAELDIFPSTSKLSVSFPASNATHANTTEGYEYRRKTTTPDTSEDTLVSVQAIPYIDFREIVKKGRKSSDPISRRAKRSQRVLENKQHDVPSLPFKPPNKVHDVPRITMPAARTALKDVQVMKAAVILPRRVHLGKAFEL